MCSGLSKISPLHLHFVTTASTVPLSWLPAGITVTYIQSKGWFIHSFCGSFYSDQIRSNGDRGSTAGISPAACGQYMGIAYDAEGQRVSPPRLLLVEPKLAYTGHPIKSDFSVDFSVDLNVAWLPSN